MSVCTIISSEKQKVPPVSAHMICVSEGSVQLLHLCASTLFLSHNKVGDAVIYIFLSLLLTGAKLRTQECCASGKIKCCSARNHIPSPKTLLIAPFLLLALCFCCQTLKRCCVSTLFRIGIPQSES